MNERYPQHRAPGSFAVETEGEITRWDTFAARRSVIRELTLHIRTGPGARGAATRSPGHHTGSRTAWWPGASAMHGGKERTARGAQGATRTEATEKPSARRLLAHDSP